jgi:hypothetical protein
LLSETDRLLVNQVDDFVSEEDRIVVVLSFQVGTDSLSEVSQQGPLIDCLPFARLLLNGCELDRLVALGIRVLGPLIGEALRELLTAH